MDYGRAPWLAPDELTAAQREYYDRLTAGPRDAASLTDAHGRLYGAFNARLLDPQIGTAIQELGAALRFGTALTDREREIVILSVARSERANYEWIAHVKVARRIGMSQTELDALLAGACAATFSDSEVATLNATSALVEHHDLDDDVFAATRDAIGLVKIFDIVSLVGHYQHTALAMRVWRVPPRDQAPPVFE
jgi:4-carboxymuconolactone decarboxylase